MFKNIYARNGVNNIVPDMQNRPKRVLENLKSNASQKDINLSMTLTYFP